VSVLVSPATWLTCACLDKTEEIRECLFRWTGIEELVQRLSVRGKEQPGTKRPRSWAFQGRERGGLSGRKNGRFLEVVSPCPIHFGKAILPWLHAGLIRPDVDCKRKSESNGNYWIEPRSDRFIWLAEVDVE